MTPATLQQGILIIIAMMIGTMITRFLPFLLFPAGKETPKFVNYLGKTLPFATMALLVVYCLKNISIIHVPHGLPEFLAILLIVILHRWKGNSLLSIGAGTVFYMVLVQAVFK